MVYLGNYLAWLVAGGVLILLEFFIPGLVIIFLGLGSFATAGVLYLGWLTDPVQLLAFFVLSSILFLATLRRLILRLYPSDSEKSESDEELLVVGQRAETISPVTAHDYSGRIRFSGTTWSARSVAGEIESRVAVEIVGRDNIHLLVKKTATM
jgi:inner membrane protein